MDLMVGGNGSNEAVVLLQAGEDSHHAVLQQAAHHPVCRNVPLKRQ